MDERELANHVLELVDRTAYEHATQRIISIQLDIGGRRIINPQRLAEVFDDAARGTVAEGAKLQVSILPVPRHCRGCGADFEGTVRDVPCPQCGHPHTEAMGGEEIRVREIQVDESAA